MIQTDWQTGTHHHNVSQQFATDHNVLAWFDLLDLFDLFDLFDLMEFEQHDFLQASSSLTPTKLLDRLCKLSNDESIPRIDLWDLWALAGVCSCLDPRECDSSSDLSDFVASFGDFLSKSFKPILVMSCHLWGHSQIYACRVREAGELLSSEELERTSNRLEKIDALWCTTCSDSTLPYCS